MNNIKKLALGLLVATFAFGFSAFTSTKNVDTVAMTQPGVWTIINVSERGSVWDCFNEGDGCTATLKENAVPNPDGSYPTTEVENIVENSHFELL